MEAFLKYQQSLMKAFVFHQADLEANRAGKLSKTQLQALRNEHDSALVAVVITVLAALGIGLALLPNNVDLFVTIALVPLVLLALGWLLQRHELANALRDPVIRVAEGQVGLKTQNMGRDRILVLVIKDLHFQVRYEEFRAVNNLGRHRIYYLLDTMKILSIEPMRDDEPLAPPTAPTKYISGYQQALMEAFGFDQNSLEANKLGAISKIQMSAISKRRRRYWIGFIIFTLAAFVLIAPGLRSGSTGTAIALLVGMPAFACLWKSWQLSRELRDQELRVAEGLLQRSNPQIIAYMQLGNLWFQVPYAQAEAVKAGEAHRIYYLPHSKAIYRSSCWTMTASLKSMNPTKSPNWIRLKMTI